MSGGAHASEAIVAIGALFEAYGAGFDDADPHAVADLFAFPAVIWQLGAGNDFDDAEELVENIDALLEVFDAAGIVLTLPNMRRMEVFGSAASATVDWRQENADGEVLHAFTCHYLLHRIEGEWRIVAIVNEEPDAEAEDA